MAESQPSRGPSRKPSEALLTYLPIVVRCGQCRNSIYVKVGQAGISKIRALVPGADVAAHLRRLPFLCHECVAGDMFADEAVARLKAELAKDKGAKQP